MALSTRRCSRLGLPTGDRFGRKPDSQAAAITQRCIMLSPVRDTMTLAGNVASAFRMKLTWGFLNQGVKISSASVKLQWLFRYPRSEPFYVTWLLPHQIKLTWGFLNQGVKISSASVKLQWLFRYPRSEPFYVTWLLPHQIKLTFGRRSRRLRQDPACGGWGSGERDHS